MFWISKPTIEAKIARAFGYEYCTLFDSARSAIRCSWTGAEWWPGALPSNVCPALWETMLKRPQIVAVDPETGLAGVGVNLYGYRDSNPTRFYEIDPLMTGYLREPRAKETVISFGRKKMLDIGAGGALLSNTKPWFGYFPEELRGELEYEWKCFYARIGERWRRVEWWDRYLGDSCIRIAQEQLMPWRVIRRIPGKRDEVVKALREGGHPVGTNYPPLPGVTDAGAIKWGKEVINFFIGSDMNDQYEIHKACEIIKRTIGQ
jgi:hypothetical protein